MKKSLLTLFLFALFYGATAQTNTFPPSGNVGIGTTSPNSFLNIIGTSSSNVEISADHYFNNFGAATINLRKARGTSSVPLAVQVDDWVSGLDGWAYNGTAFFRTNYIGTVVTGSPTSSGIPTDMVFATNAGGTDALEKLRITSQGNVGIGITTPSEKLSVNGNIRAREVKVETANWPDYVFAKDYQLPSLVETERYIKEKGHLIGIPSAEEVKANGFSLGEMNARLLEKIEELTLHLIAKDKELSGERLINKNQEDRLKVLEDKLLKNQTRL